MMSPLRGYVSKPCSIYAHMQILNFEFHPRGEKRSSSLKIFPPNLMQPHRHIVYSGANAGGISFLFHYFFLSIYETRLKSPDARKAHDQRELAESLHWFFERAQELENVWECSARALMRFSWPTWRHAGAEIFGQFEPTVSLAWLMLQRRDEGAYIYAIRLLQKKRCIVVVRLI